MICLIERNVIEERRAANTGLAMFHSYEGSEYCVVYRGR